MPFKSNFDSKDDDIGFFQDPIDGNLSYSVAENNPFEPLLMTDEHILWMGKGKRSNQGTIFEKIFGVIWLLFSIFWTVSAFVGGGGLFAMFGLPFIAVGIGLISGFKSPKSKKICDYAVTNKRIITHNGDSFIMAEYLDKVGDARIYPTKNHLCDIQFSNISPIYANLKVNGRRMESETYTAFHGLDNYTANEVVNIINSAQMVYERNVK